MEIQTDSKKRFSSRAIYYAKYRPKYPLDVINFLQDEIQLSSSHIVADIGSGTGNVSELFLKNGNVVYGVEPNKEMRESAEALLKDYPNFKSIDASAEETTLESHSIDLITIGQALQWFDIDKSKEEFKRILKPTGWVIVIRNSREEETPFSKDYNDLHNKYAIDHKFDRSKIEKYVNQLFSQYKMKSFDNFQSLDYQSFEGLLLSYSSIPMQGHANYEPMIEELKRIFNKYQENGVIKLKYYTKVYYGKL